MALLWLFRALNPLMPALLRSPLHGLLSGMLMLLSYRGRKSGKVYTIPIGYFVWGTDELMGFTSARWWTNLRDGAPVTLLLKGQRLQAVPTVIHEREAVISTLEEFIGRLGLATARKLPVGLPADRAPTQVELRAIPRVCPHTTIFPTGVASKMALILSPRAATAGARCSAAP
jgi:hypothetical protein